MNETSGLLKKPEFPRSAKYDADWVMDNQMEPNALWLTEWLCQGLALEPGMRVLDLGCGKAVSSIFLAREFGAQVFAADLWMSPDPNWRRAVEAAGKSIFPSDAEALDRDRGEYLGFIRLTARRTDEAGEDMYDPALGVKVGVDV